MACNNLCAVLKKRKELCLEYRTVPEPLPHEVLIAIHSVGICGSDVHFYETGNLGDFALKEPMVLGHESSGTVVKVGDNVTYLKEGDRVCIEPGFGCSRCDFCRQGRYNLCPDVTFCATPPTDGTLCNYFRTNADFCYKLPDHVTLEEGAMIEPLCVAFYACNRAGVTAGKSVLICGAGPIGLSNILICKALGVSRIVIVDLNKKRLKFAERLGATSSICVKDMPIETVIKEVIARLGQQPSITIECSGAETSVRLGLKVTRSGGVLMLVGFGASEMKVPLVEAIAREIDIRGSWRYANSYPSTLELVASGAVDVKSLITHRFELEDSVKGFETAKSGEAIKVIINCAK